MKQSVTIKGTVLKEDAVGMTVNLDPDLPFSRLLADVASQFEETGKFFRNAKVILSFEGRSLSAEEQDQLIETIRTHAPLHITYVVDAVPERREEFARLQDQLRRREDSLKDPSCQSGQFYRGSLRDGQRLEIEGDLLILGDIQAGARVVAGGSILVIGAIRGHAFAGMSGRSDAFILAMDMLPTQLRIGDLVLNGRDPACSARRKTPVIARRKEERIVLEPLNDFDVSDL